MTRTAFLARAAVLVPLSPVLDYLRSRETHEASRAKKILEGMLEGEVPRPLSREWRMWRLRPYAEAIVRRVDQTRDIRLAARVYRIPPLRSI